MRSRIVCAALLLSSPLWGADSRPAPEPSIIAAPLSLDWVLGEVEKHNPDIAAARSELLMKEGEALTARAYPDPLLTYEWMGEMGHAFHLGGLFSRRLELTQMIPFPGRTLMAGRQADLAAARMSAMLRDKIEAKAEGAKRAYFELAAAGLALRAQSKASQAAEDLAALSAGRGRFGRLDRMGQLMDAMIKMLSGDLERMRPHYEQERRMAEASLNALMGADAGRALPEPGPEAELPAGDQPWDEATVWQQAQRTNPMLEEAYHHQGHADQAYRRELAGWLPDLMLQAGWEEDPMGLQATSAMLGLTLPGIWSWGQAGKVKAAAAEREHAHARSVASILDLKEQLRGATGELASSAAQLKISRDKILPSADKALAQAVEGFRSGVVTATDAANAVKEYWMAQETHARLLSQTGAALAALERLTGRRTAAMKKEMSHD